MSTRHALVLAAAAVAAACTPVTPTAPGERAAIAPHKGRPQTQVTPPAPRSEAIRVAPAAADAAQASQGTPTAKRQAMNGVRANGTLPRTIAPGGMPGVDRERYADIDDNGIRLVSEHPVSTFSIDVDTASYANVRRLLNDGRLPPANAVRVEEMINYFDYDDPRPKHRDTPFLVSAEMAPTPWNRDTRLLRIALNAWDVETQDLPPSNLVFLVDVSGSMHSRDKLPLLKKALQLLTHKTDADDRISLVVYAGAAGVVLEPTPGDQRATIAQALDELRAGGATHGSAGIALAYAKAREAFIDGGINRVILATDGDFNVGTVDHAALIDLVERERRSGIALTTLGFGRGNLNDHLMEQLADRGNGNYAYIDSLLEAQKALVEQIGGTLYSVASDVKLQLEFNPARVAEYRLIGYENRLLAREDFNNDQVDAGELGAGHSVVALYEIAETDSAGRRIDPLRYADGDTSTRTPAQRDEFAHVKLRYKPIDSNQSRLLTLPLTGEHLDARGSDNLRFAAAVAAFGQALRGGTHLNGYTFGDIEQLARQARGDDPAGYRADFLRLVRLADSLAAVNGSGTIAHSDHD
jgi:Ca-activated chloride channel family protein